MKTSAIITVTVLFVFSACHTMQNMQATGVMNQIAKDSRGNEMLIGKCTRDALNNPPFDAWFIKNYNEYTVEPGSVKPIKSLLKNKTVAIFLGTWCGDSKREVPRMMKILDACDFPGKQLQLIMVSNHADMYKQSPQHEEAGKNIFRVPTFIFYDKARLNDSVGQETEIGRIIESPVVSLEKDMLKILRKENYKPNYSN